VPAWGNTEIAGRARQNQWLSRFGFPNHRSVLREEPLSLPQRYLKVVSELVTPGAVGVALLLGSAAPAAASQDSASQQSARAPEERVSERLAAIREAVSAVSGPETQTEERAGDRRLAWHNGWGNGGLGLGFGWGSPWANFNMGQPWNNWNNWRNGWNNWRNGWGNW
jgi:rSAM-associated Gly-rich repeat protein